MHSAHFLRLFWKDARSQLALWCALVAGAMLLQALIIGTAGGARNAGAALEVVGAVAFVLTACFTVACVGVLFAGEAEEGTREWLQQLPIRPWTLVSAKLSLALVSTALFLAATCLSGLAVAVLAGYTLEELLKADVSQYQKSLIGAFAWGLLFSLLLRRVTYVLLAAVAAEIITVAMTDNVVGPYLALDALNLQTLDSMRLWGYVAVTSIILLLDVILANRWARVGGTVAAIGPRRRLKSLAIPGGERRARAWLNRVAWASRRGSPEARATAVLAWREARPLVPFAGVWIVLGFVATDLPQLLGSSGHWRANSPFPILFLIATPVVCGLLTCLGDQRQQMYRFLGERGVAPARVWCVKQVVWLLAAVVLTLLFVRWDFDAAERLRQNTQSGVSLFMIFIRSLHVPGAPGDTAFDRPDDTALQLHFLWALGCSLFAAGQCASFWIRRPILGFGVMLIVAPVLVGWHFGLATLDVPFWIGSWPLTFALLAATLSSASAWLRGRDSWRLRLTRLAAVALPVGTVALAAAVHRAYSVPSPVFNWHLASAITTREIAISSPDPGWSTRWNVVLRNFPQTPYSGQLPLQYTGDAVATRERLLALGEELAAGRERRLDPLVLSPDRPVSVQAIATFLTELSHLDLEARRGAVVAGTLDEQRRGYEAGLRIASYLAEQSQSSGQWLDCMLARGVLLAAIRQWAQGPDQTPESLEQAAVILWRNDAQPSESMRDMSVNRHVFYTELLNRRGRKWNELAANPNSRFAGIDASIAGAWLPWFERERANRVLGHVTNECLSGHNTMMDAFSQRGDTLRRWSASTSALPANILWEIYAQDLSGQFLAGSNQGHARRAGTQHEATEQIVSIQRYRLKHGEIPVSLSAGYDDGFEIPIPAAGLLYEPRGLPADLQLPDGRVIPAGQPLLLSPGHLNAQLQRTVMYERAAEATVVTDVYRVDGRVYDEDKFPHVRFPLDPAKIVFVDLSTFEADLPPAAPEMPSPAALTPQQ